MDTPGTPDRIDLPAVTPPGAMGEERQPFVRHARSDAQVILATMADHDARGVPLPENLVRAAVACAAQLLGSNNDRLKARGMDFVLGALALNMKRFAEADRIARLDGGLPTERTEHQGAVEFDITTLARTDPSVARELLRLAREGRA